VFTKLDKKKKGWPPVRFFIFGLIALISIFIFVTEPFGFSDELSSSAVLVLLVVGALATGVIPEQITILIFFLLAMLFVVAAPQIVFSGFMSGAFWLVFGGLIIGTAVEITGLGNRIAQGLISYVSGSYMWVVATIVLINGILIFLMPSTLSRVVLLIPIIMSISDQMGYSRGSKPANGLVMATVLTAYLCSTSVLPANVPNNVLMGASETFLNTPVRYFEYFLLHFPILGFLKAIIIWGAVVYLFKPEKSKVNTAIGDTRSIKKLKTQLLKDERRILILLMCALLLWATDAVHGITPAWISLAIGIAC
jgi:di/tricarboxylate transporter